ncbi:hypothetical protein ATCC90586_005816 [Pythium insidiosum]|nr:hypothetical protein ATCC90586_005816 [Pythium insidiosum]
MTSIASPSPVLPFAAFRGHRDAVNALLCDDDKRPHVLVSGSDDGTCRLWDVRSTRAIKCLNVKKALAQSDAGVNSMAFGDSDTLYVATGNKVLTFDLRQDGLVLDSLTQPPFQDSDEEINTLTVQPKKARYLAAPDDNGDIRVYDLEAKRLFKTLRGQHTNLCMTAPFRPNAPWDLVSGGMDGLLLFWDFSRGRLKFCIDLNAGVNALDASASAAPPTESQLFNPPLVHSVAFASNGKTFAAGLGDATIAVVDFAAKRIVRRLRSHQATVSQVHFPAFRRDDWLLSCGNDAQLCVWDYASAVVPEEGDASETDACLVKRFGLPDKPNAIATSLHQNLVHVADTSSIIASYPLM